MTYLNMSYAIAGGVPRALVLLGAAGMFLFARALLRTRPSAPIVAFRSALVLPVLFTEPHSDVCGS